MLPYLLIEDGEVSYAYFTGGCPKKGNVYMGKYVDILGQKFNRLTTIKYIGNGNWLCQCECGNTCVTNRWSLSHGRTKSCGCLNRENVIKRNKAMGTHGLSHTRQYEIWVGILKRCNNKKCWAYPYYGGRGITVCDEWSDKVEGFINFYNWSFSSGYSDNLTIDRIDSNGNYEPSNCRWVTMKEQNRNRRDTLKVNYNDKEWCLHDLVEYLGIPLSYETVYSRLHIYGYSLEDALFLPKGSTKYQKRITIEYAGMCKTIKEWSEYLHVKENTFRSRCSYHKGDMSKIFLEIDENGNKINNTAT